MNFALTKVGRETWASIVPIVAAIAMGLPATGAMAALAPTSSPASNPPVSTAMTPEVRQLLSDAQKALKGGNIGLARILLKNAATQAPQNGMVHAQLGLVLLRSGDAAGAERELRQARANGAPAQIAVAGLLQVMLIRHEYQNLLNEFPDPGASAQGSDDATLLKARALALQAVGQPQSAAETMDRSLALRRDVPGLLTRAQFAQQQGNTPLAKSLTDEALKLDPNNASALVFRLGLLMAAKDTNAALALSSQLIKDHPDDLAVRLARIEIFLQLKNDPSAKAEVDTILSKAPSSPFGLYYKALLLARANDIKGAWHIAQSLPPEFTQMQPAIAMMVAQMAIGSGNIETGAAILTSALAKSPDLLDLRLRLAAVRLRQGGPEAALDVLRPVKDSSDPRVLALESLAYTQLKRNADALAVLDKLNITGKASLGLETQRALLEMRVGQSDQAIKDLLDLAAKQPTTPIVITPLVAMLVQAKRFPEALAAADGLGKDPKQQVQSFFLRGEILAAQGEGNAALDAFGKALQLDPKNVRSLYFRAIVLEGMRKYPDAARDLQTILKIDPKNGPAYIKLAELAMLQGQDKDVQSFLGKAISLAPTDPPPRIALIKYRLIRRDFNGALSAANDMVAKIPNNGDGVAMLGQIQLALGQKTQAIATFRRLSALLPKSAGPMLYLANALFANGDVKGATSALATAKTLEPNSGDVSAAVINLLIAQGNTKGAVAAAQSYQSANPGSAADILVADTLVKAKRFDDATAVLTKSFASKPNAPILLRLVELKTHAGDKTGAEKLLTDWLKNNPHDLAVRAQYASTLMVQGDPIRAAAQYDLVLQQDPNNIAALNNLAWLIQKSDTKRALSLAQRANSLSPNSPDALDTWGMIQLGAGDAKGALDHLNRAHELRQTDPEIAFHFALGLDATGNRKAAKALVEKLVASGATFDDLTRAKQLLATWH